MPTLTQFHPTIFTSTAHIQLITKQNDSISTCNYSAYANDLLSTYHQQETNSAIQTIPPPTIGPSTISSLTEKDLDALFERMKPNIPLGKTSTGIMIDEL
jgi:hypothetical protein